MRSLTIDEAQRNPGGVFQTAANEPVRIQLEGRAVIVVSASEFDEAQRLLHRKRMRALHRARLRAAAEAEANGFTEDMLPDFLAR